MQVELQKSTSWALCLTKCIDFNRDELLLPCIVMYLYFLRLSPREKVWDLNLLLLKRMVVNRLLFKICVKLNIYN